MEKNSPFQTFCEIEEPGFYLNYKDKVMAVGSCFVESIGQKMLSVGMRGAINPLGVMYNPISIVDNLGLLSGQQKLDFEDLFESQGRHRHWKVHSKLSKPTKKDTVEAIAQAIELGQSAYCQSTVLLITLGVAWAWQKGGEVVANCHKIPGKHFQRTLLSIDQMLLRLNNSMVDYLGQNERRRIILTVSPVRYLRDGLIDSNRSKARLLEVAHRLAESDDRIVYFPAYEIVNDQLRDYRFFSEDMVHPAPVAVNYVWHRFRAAFFDKVSLEYVQESENILKMKQHRVQFPETDAAKKFVQSIAQRECELKQKFPFDG